MTPKEFNDVLILLAAQGDLKKAVEIKHYFAGMVEKPADAKPVPTDKTPDGVYLYFGPGCYKPYTPGDVSDEDKARTVGIGYKLGSKAVVVALSDIPGNEDGDVTLTTAKSPDGYDESAYRGWETANADWDGQGNTDRLRAAGILNPQIDDNLPAQFYVPAMGEMRFIHLFLSEINQALVAVGGSKIAPDWWYWSSTEYSTNSAWTLHLNYGHMYYYTKASYTHRVRPVSAFIL